MAQGQQLKLHKWRQLLLIIKQVLGAHYVPPAFIARSGKWDNFGHISVKSCHSRQIMSFSSNNVIHVKPCQSCQVMSCQYVSLGLSRPKLNEVGEGREGQTCRPKPSATASLSGQRQKH
jgi:hypothetical protein